MRLNRFDLEYIHQLQKVYILDVDYLLYGPHKLLIHVVKYTYLH